MLDYTIDISRRLVRISGDYATGTEWLLLFGRLRRDRTLAPHSRFLRDVRDAARRPDARMAATTANLLHRFWRELNIAMWAVVTSDAEDVVASAMVALGQQTGLAIRAFTSIDEAMAWLMDETAAAAQSQSERT